MGRGKQAAGLPGLDYWRSSFWQIALVLAVGTLFGTVVATGEELGWRGYALPRLQARHHPLAASAIVGWWWGLWHFDELVNGSTTEYGIADILLFTAGTISASVIYTWLCNNTRGSVLIACLFHSVYDVTLIWFGAIVPVPPGERWIGLAGLAAVALMVIVLAGPRLSYEVFQKHVKHKEAHHE